MSNKENSVYFIAHGEPASKANSRKLVTIGGKPRFIKSQKARNYVRDFQLQCPKRYPLFTCDLSVEIKIYYATRRPDLDESVILDAMEGLIYKNDRQVKRKLITWGLDKEDPRAEILVEPYDVQS